MIEKRFIIETVEITDCKTGKSRIVKVITDTYELCSCEDLYELCDDLNKLAEENEQLKEERNYFERKKCEYFNKYNKKHLGNIQLKEENEQLQKYNEQLKERLEKINGGYGHLTHRNGLTANEWLIESQERELKKKNEEISDWIERHSKDIAKIGEQKSTISQLEEENEQLKKRLEHYKEVEAMNGDGKNE